MSKSFRYKISISVAFFFFLISQFEHRHITVCEQSVQWLSVVALPLVRFSANAKHYFFFYEYNNIYAPVKQRVGASGWITRGVSH